MLQGPPQTVQEVDATAPYLSILNDPAEGPPADGPALGTPAYFADLHLSDVVHAVAGGRGAELERAFIQPLHSVAAIEYRHDVFRDLEDPQLLATVRTFGERMANVQRRQVHSTKARFGADRDRWLLSAAEAYAAAVSELSGRLMDLQPRSVALRAFRDHLASYVTSAEFTDFVSDTQQTKERLERVRYRLRLHEDKVTVTRARDEPDLGQEVLATFGKFRQEGVVKHYEWRLDPDSDMNHVEAALVERVARLEPEAFRELRTYAERHAAFMDPVIGRFDHEVRFYLAWLDFTHGLRDAGLAFSYPTVSTDSRGVEACGIFDLALAASLHKDGQPTVANDLELSERERIVVVSGPNQGGKTTFARAIGQLHHLARIGVPVPGVRVRVPLVDQIFTHFERREQVEDLSSKLEDDLRRIHRILDQATADSVVIMNESFTSTTVADQLFIGRAVLRRVLDAGLLCVIVTFLDELCEVDPNVVSMVSSVDPDDVTRRTFQITRRPPDGLAYAVAIAEKHRVTYPQLKERLDR